jgi:hypothetical protein
MTLALQMGAMKKAMYPEIWLVTRLEIQKIKRAFICLCDPIFFNEVFLLAHQSFGRFICEGFQPYVDYMRSWS